MMAADCFFTVTKPAWLLSYERTNPETFLLLYVNSIEKQTGTKNTGLKIPENDQI